MGRPWHVSALANAFSGRLQISGVFVVGAGRKGLELTLLSRVPSPSEIVGEISLSDLFEVGTEK